MSKIMHTPCAQLIWTHLKALIYIEIARNRVAQAEETK